MSPRNTISVCSAPTLFVGMVVCLLCATVVPSSAQRRNGGKPELAVAIVNGVRIPMAEYDRLVSDQLSLQLRSGGTQVVDQAIRDQLLMQLVDQELVRQEAERRGVRVTREQARRALIKDPPDFILQNFVDEKGVFQREAFAAVVNNPALIAQMADPAQNRDSVVSRWRTDVEKLVTYVQHREVRRGLADRLIKEQPLTDRMIRDRFFAERTIFDGSFVRILHSTIPDSAVPVQEQELRAWYDSHIKDYSFPSQRQVGSLIIPIEPLAEDTLRQTRAINDVRTRFTQTPIEQRPAFIRSIAATLPPNRIPEGELVKLQRLPSEIHAPLMAAHQGDLIGPFVVNDEKLLLYVGERPTHGDTLLRVRHILVRIESDEPGADSIVRQFTEDLKGRITNRETFIEAAQAFSQDASKAQGGDLGYISRGLMVPEFERAAFSAPLNTVVGPFRTSFGYHILMVEDIQTDGFRLTELRFQLPISDQARRSAMLDAESWAAALRTDNPASDSIYRSIRLRNPRAIADTSVLKRLDIYGDVLGVATFAFSKQPGDVMVEQIPGDRVIVSELLQAWPSGVAPYDKIRWNFVLPHVRREKQLRMLRPIAESLADSLTPETPLGIIRLTAPMSEAFMIQKQALDSPPDEPTTLLDSLFEKTPDGAVSGPVRGTHGYYFLRISQRRNAPTSADFARERKTYTAEYRERYRNDLVEAAMKRNREYADLQDLRPTVRMSSAGE